MSKRKTKEEFIEEAKLIHNNKYDYSLVEYKNNKTKVKIICKKHGLFEQRPNDHLKGCGCKSCADEEIAKLNSSSLEEFLQKSKEVYGDKYDYSLVEYKNNTTKVKIKCPEHGIFKQAPINHLYSGGCKKCGDLSKKLTEQEIINSLPEQYEYTVLQKNDIASKYEILGVCRQCGKEFRKKYSSWKFGSNVCSCSKDQRSVGEIKVEKYLVSNNIQFESAKTFPGLRDKKSLSYDFYLKDYNLLIECQGEQHYKPKNFGGISRQKALDNFKIQQYHDQLKRQYAADNNFSLLEISYKDYNIIEEVLKNYLENSK